MTQAPQAQSRSPLSSRIHSIRAASLILEDGTQFQGSSIGALGTTVGELVFNTSATGYQEILTDPSYARQVVTLTCAHVGNTGCNREDEESERSHATGLVIRERPRQPSSWRSQVSLSQWLQDRGVVAIADIDTRRLTHVLREKGSLRCAIGTASDAGTPPDPKPLLQAAQAFGGLVGVDLASTVTTPAVYEWTERVTEIARTDLSRTNRNPHVVVYDFGVKRQILRQLVEHGCRVTVVPAKTSASDVLAHQPDGVLLSNGPGDPAACGYAIIAVRLLLEAGVPLFGVCLGHQLLALAAGAQTFKLKFGHHGANHPVRDLATGRALITSQNHGFAVEEASLPDGLTITHRSLFDGTIQGLELQNAPAFGFQGHPEAAPGPNDLHPLFARFVARMETTKHA